MKVLVVNTNRCANPIAVVPMGACAVAEAAEAAGHTVRFVDLMFSREPGRALQDAVRAFDPDVVGLSVRNIDNYAMLAPRFFLDDLRGHVDRVRAATRAPIVLGGAALGVMPEEILRLAGVGVAVTGEGETVFPRLLERMAARAPLRDLPGVAVLEDGAFSWTPLPPSEAPAPCPSPALERWVAMRAYRQQMAAAPVRTKDGCQFRCVYCLHAAGGGIRVAPPERVADAVARHVDAGLRDVDVVDDVFNAPREHAIQVCEAIARRRVPARLQCLELSARDLDDALLSAMERAGFVGMGVTLESASDPVLARMRKGFTGEHAAAAVEVVRRHGIPCAWIFVLGGPGETRETVEESLRFAEERIPPSDIVFFNVGLRIFAGTELERIARAEGLLHAPRSELLRPAFYVSPHVETAWMREQVKQRTRRCMNFIDADTMNYDFMPALNRVSRWLGVQPPLWRYSRFFNRVLRTTGLG